MAMSFAGNSLFAQNVNTSGENQGTIDLIASDESEGSDVVDTSTVPTSSAADLDASDAKGTEESSASPGAKIITGPGSVEDMALIAASNDTKTGRKKNILDRQDYLYVTSSKKSQKGFFIGQQIELSLMAGFDKSPAEFALAKMGLSPKASDEKDFSSNFSDKNNRPNFGANFAYSVIFVPAHLEGEQLVLNPFGFAFSTGALFQFDNEKDVGMTCDFLGKFGVETGYNKKLGAGVSLLFGGGKTAEAVVDFSYIDADDPDFDDLEITQESKWCAKAGTEIWVRYKIPEQSDKFDVNTAIFTRFVYSFQPYSEDDALKRMEMYDEIPYWKPEGWSFGLKMWLEF